MRRDGAKLLRHLLEHIASRCLSSPGVGDISKRSALPRVGLLRRSSHGIPVSCVVEHIIIIIVGVVGVAVRFLSSCSFLFRYRRA